MDAAKSKNTIIAGVFSKNHGLRASGTLKNQQKSYPKSMKNCIDDKMDVGMDVGRLLDRFLIDFGTVLGGKLAPSWHQNLKKEDTKTMSKIEWSKTHAGKMGVGGWKEGNGGLGP